MTKQAILGLAISIVLSPYALAQEGYASWYGDSQAVACGGRFNPEAMTAAHRTLACGSVVRVTDHVTGKSVTVTITDRGPFVAGRIIDLSRAAARELDMLGRGLARVTVQPIR